MIPDLTKIKPDFAVGKTVKKAELPLWKTNEQIDVKALYEAKDLDKMQHLDFLSGFAPYLRGP